MNEIKYKLVGKEPVCSGDGTCPQWRERGAGGGWCRANSGRQTWEHEPCIPGVYQQRDALKKKRANLRLWTEANCTCGGDGPNTGCLACQAYHAAGLGDEA